MESRQFSDDVVFDINGGNRIDDEEENDEMELNIDKQKKCQIEYTTYQTIEGMLTLRNDSNISVSGPSSSNSSSINNSSQIKFSRSIHKNESISSPLQKENPQENKDLNIIGTQQYTWGDNHIYMFICEIITNILKLKRNDLRNELERIGLYKEVGRSELFEIYKNTCIEDGSLTTMNNNGSLTNIKIEFKLII
jgi:hypothetical protein